MAKGKGKDEMAKDDKRTGAPQAGGALPLFYRKPRPLDVRTHTGKKLKREANFSFAKGTNSVPINAVEFPLIQRSYPIVFSGEAVPVPLAVMGEGSRSALARHGVVAGSYQITSPLDTQRTDSQTLLQALDVPRLQGGRVLIIRGESGRELLADALRDAGIEVQQVAAYRRAAPQLDAALRQHLSDLLNQDCDWIITSSEALHILIGFVQQVDTQTGVEKIQHKNLFVPHRRIAETAVSLGFRHVFLTGSGDEGLLTALQSTP